jgi:hypothetical protein
MPWVGFEHTMAKFEGEKTFHAADRAATVVGPKYEARKFTENVLWHLPNDSTFYSSNWRWRTWTVACYLRQILFSRSKLYLPFRFSNQNTGLHVSSPHAYYTTIQRSSLSSGVGSVSTCCSGGHGFVSQLEYWLSWIRVFVVVLSYHRSRGSVFGIATGYGLDNWGVGVQVPAESRIFSFPNHPDRLWGPPNLLSTGYVCPTRKHLLLGNVWDGTKVEGWSKIADCVKWLWAELTGFICDNICHVATTRPDWL